MIGLIMVPFRKNLSLVMVVKEEIEVAEILLLYNIMLVLPTMAGVQLSKSTYNHGKGDDACNLDQNKLFAVSMRYARTNGGDNQAPKLSLKMPEFTGHLIPDSFVGLTKIVWLWSSLVKKFK